MCTRSMGGELPGEEMATLPCSHYWDEEEVAQAGKAKHPVVALFDVDIAQWFGKVVGFHLQ